jgi:tetratricopeptide (TPR) repeat protein
MSTITTASDLKAQADQLYASRQYPEAIDLYRQVLELTPMSIPTMRSLGLALILSQQLDEGLEYCRRAASIEPRDPENRYAYGYGLGVANQYREATYEFDEVLALQPYHIPAKNALVYSLLNYSKQLADNDLIAAEGPLDRAYKVDSGNPEVVAALLGLYHESGQRGKAMKLLGSMPDPIKNHGMVRPVVERIERDPEYQTALRQAAVSQQVTRTSGATAAPHQPAMHQIPCPNCRQMIMNFAAICPHCNFQLRQVGTFAGRDRGPAYAWQEIALTIMALLWIIAAGFDFYRGMQVQIEGLQGFLLILAGSRLVVGLGLLFRSEWISFIAKILCYISLFSGGYGFMITMAMGDVVGMIVNAITIGVAGFLVYLINYCMD